MRGVRFVPFTQADFHAWLVQAIPAFALTNVQDGRWTAWWPGSDHDNGGVPDSVTLTFADGTTRTVTGDSLFDK